MHAPVIPSLYAAFCVVIDALDECVTNQRQLLDFIVQKSSTSPHVKWIISSRNWPNVEERLETAMQKVRLCLELNEESVSAAVGKYIRHRVGKLARSKRYGSNTQKAIRNYLSLNANGTFLWVALVCQELEKILGPVTRAKLTAFPPGLDSLYERMMEQVCRSDSADICRQILSIVAVVYRPITMEELTSFVDMPEDISDVDMLEDMSDVDMLDYISDVDMLEHNSDGFKSLKKVIGLCGSFLTLRGYSIYFVHKSAKDFLLKQASGRVFPSGIQEKHHDLLSKSLEIMSRTLRRDMYELQAPGFPIDQVGPLDLDQLATARYSCLYWVDHLLDSDTRGNTSSDLKDGGSVDIFLRQSYLY